MRARARAYVSVFVFGCVNVRADALLRTQTRVQPGENHTRSSRENFQGSTCILEQPRPLPLYGRNKITAAHKMPPYRHAMFQSQQDGGMCQGPVADGMKYQY